MLCCQLLWALLPTRPLLSPFRQWLRFRHLATALSISLCLCASVGSGREGEIHSIKFLEKMKNHNNTDTRTMTPTTAGPAHSLPSTNGPYRCSPIGLLRLALLTACCLVTPSAATEILGAGQGRPAGIYIRRPHRALRVAAFFFLLAFLAKQLFQRRLMIPLDFCERRVEFFFEKFAARCEKPFP